MTRKFALPAAVTAQFPLRTLLPAGPSLERLKRDRMTILIAATVPTELKKPNLL
jgi:hypothetical protein